MAGIQPVPRRNQGRENLNAHEWRRWREDIRKSVDDFETAIGGDLSGLEARVTQNETDIAQNQSDIAVNSINIAANTANIAQNASDISDLQLQVGGFNSFELGPYRAYDYSVDVSNSYDTFILSFSTDVTRNVASSFGSAKMNLRYTNSTGLVDFYFRLIPDITVNTIYGTCQAVGLDVTDGAQKLLGTVYDSKLGAISDTELDNFYVQRSGTEIRFGFVSGYHAAIYELSVTKLK